ncbi:MAG: Fe-S oxidoreductase [Candidatus Odinarchaeota archaeon]
MQVEKILLVEPDFPYFKYNHKSRKKSFSSGKRQIIPIGLLKLASYYRKKGSEIQLVRGLLPANDVKFIPSKILITSLFTYWAHIVRKTVLHYRSLFPSSHIVVGGIYATLMSDHCKKYTSCDEVFIGLHNEAEKCVPAYDLVETASNSLEYQILWTTRGCSRRCGYCGVSKLESQFTYKSSIKDEIYYKKVVFYDNNFLANPHVIRILKELAELKESKSLIWSEVQCGLDRQYILRRPYLANHLKKAGFRYPKIAWDDSFDKKDEVKSVLNSLMKAGYNARNIGVFMLYNHDLPFSELEKKRKLCFEWGVQIMDCRYRPLDNTFDQYNPYNKSDMKYYIHKKGGWKNHLVRRFRKNIRRTNICIRHRTKYYIPLKEREKITKEIKKELGMLDSTKKKIDYLRKKKIKVWNPMTSWT